MSVFQYEENGVTLFGVRVHVRSRKSRKIRAQKRLIGITTREEADKLDAHWTKWAMREVARRENEGLSWREVLSAWEEWYKRFPSDRWDPGTVQDYIATCRNWTSDWLDRPARDLQVSDGFQMIEEARQAGASTQRLYQIKTTVNVVYKWGIESGKIQHKDHSPMFGIELKKRDSEKVPEILNKDQLGLLLAKADEAEHDWSAIWKVATYTGMRASELEGLRKEDIELVPPEVADALMRVPDRKKSFGMIRVSRQWKKKEGKYGALKGRYWRSVPVNGPLYQFLTGYLAQDFGADEHGRRVFPLHAEHRRGEQARVLKTFCASAGLKEIKFHTLRACFATHLLAAGTPEVQVMKVGGWKDRETMMRYIRQAGIDEAGATEGLDFEVRKPLFDAAVGAENVVSIFSRRG